MLTAFPLSFFLGLVSEGLYRGAPDICAEKAVENIGSSV